MEESDISKTIIERTIHEISIQIPYCEVNTLYNYLSSITTRQPFYLVYQFERYRMKKYSDNHDILNYKLGSNMFIIILPLEGEVIVTTFNILEKISGLSLWVSSPYMREKLLQFDVYNYDISREPTKSPFIIVSELPSKSFILEDTLNNNKKKVTTVHELLKYPE